MNLTVKQLSLEHDIQAAYHIHCQVVYTPWQLSTFADCTTQPYYALMLLDNNQIIGYAIMLMVVDEATIMDIAVVSGRRGEGAGKFLLRAVIETCRLQDMSSIWLEVRAGNQVANQLYQKAGFSLIELRRDYYPAEGGREDACIMQYRL